MSVAEVRHTLLWLSQMLTEIYHGDRGFEDVDFVNEQLQKVIASLPPPPEPPFTPNV